MSSSLNLVVLQGNVGKAPETRFTASGTAVGSFSLATSESYKDKGGEWQEKTDWHNIVVWGKLAELVQEHVTKGSKILVKGSIHTRKWQDKDGNDRYSTEIKADQVNFLDKAGKSADGGDSGGGYQGDDDIPY